MGVVNNTGIPALFGDADTFDGEGLWILEPNQTIRTIRPGMTTVFMVVGSNDPTKLTLDEEDAFLRKSEPKRWNLIRPIDLNHFEFVYITFTELLTNMGPGRAAGKADLMKKINSLAPGQKFIICGLSEGAAVASDVYDELRGGSPLQAKNQDFLGGFMCGNPRRGTGVTFPGYPDPAPGTSGTANVRLLSTETRWWEMAVADDPVTCVSDTSNLGKWQRKLYEMVHQPGGTTQAAVLGAVKASKDPDATKALNLFLGLATSGHAHYKDRMPYAGDSRSFIQVGVDHVNGLPSPVVAPVLHQIRSEPKMVTAGQTLTAGASFTWWNLPTFSGTAIKVAVSAYSSSGSLIADVAANTSVFTASPVVKNPPPNNTSPKALSGKFKMPAGTTHAKLLIEVASEVMATGIVRFSAPKL